MKKIMNWMLAAILISGASVFTSCSKADEPVTPVDNKKCTRVQVIYRITSPKTNYTFFEGKYAIKSGGEVKEINKLLTFSEGYNEAYNVNDIVAFPVQEAICLHYGIKELESYKGEYSLNWEMSYTVTSYNAKGDELDSQTITDHWNEKGSVGEKADLENAVKLSYSELHASVAEDGTVTLSRENRMHPEKSGIDW